VVAAISLTALEMVASLTSLREHLPSLVAAAHAVSHNLGHVEGAGNAP